MHLLFTASLVRLMLSNRLRGVGIFSGLELGILQRLAWIALLDIRRLFIKSSANFNHITI